MKKQQSEYELQNTFDYKSPIFLHEDSWISNYTVSQTDLDALQVEEEKRLGNVNQEHKINYILKDLEKKVHATDIAYKIYSAKSSSLKKEDYVRLAEYEHGQRKISSKEASEFGTIKESLHNYQMQKLSTLYSFSAMTKLCIAQGVGRDKILEHHATIDKGFPEGTNEYATFHDCYLQSTWSSLVIASKYKLDKLLGLTANILETPLADSESQLMRLKHALPFNILMEQKIDNDDLEEVFESTKEGKLLAKIFIECLDDAFKISKEKYSNFVQKNTDLEDLLIKYGLDIKSNPTFKDIVTFLSSNKILSSFEQQNNGVSKALKQVYEKVKTLLGNTDYFAEDAFYHIATLPDEIFSKEISAQSGKTSKALCMWSKFFLQSDINNGTYVNATPNEQNQSVSLKKNFVIYAKDNVLTYEEGDEDEEWCIVDKISEHMPKGRYKSENVLNQNMYDEYQGMIKFLAKQSQGLNVKLMHRQHEQSFNQPSFESEFNRTFNQEIQQPSVSFGVNMSGDKSKWLDDLLSNLGKSDQVLNYEEQQLLGTSNILDELNLNNE